MFEGEVETGGARVGDEVETEEGWVEVVETGEDEVGTGGVGVEAGVGTAVEAGEDEVGTGGTGVEDGKGRIGRGDVVRSCHSGTGYSVS